MAVIAISWVSKLQKLIGPSSTKVEYVVVGASNKEMLWLQLFLEELMQT